MLKKWMIAGFLLALLLPTAAQAVEAGASVTMTQGEQTQQADSFIPAQTVMQVYGADLFYHYNSQMFLLMKGSNSVYFQVNQTVIYVNGQQVNTGVAAKYENKALVIPSSYLTEGLKLTNGLQSPLPVEQQIKQAAVSLLGTWELYIPSVSWETIDANTDLGSLHAAAGAVSGTLTIKDDGTYTWSSLQQGRTISGKWVYTASLEEPIMLLAGEGTDDYRVGLYKGEMYLNAKGTGWLYYCSGKKKK